VVAPTSPEEIIQLGQTMHITHSSGPDDIDPCIANPYLNLLALPLAAIFNASFMTGIIPSALKMAKVVPIFKQGNRAEASNYRPISILPYFAKLLEKLMYIRLYNYICQNNFLYPLQHGFQSGHSTAMSLIDLQDKISLAIDNNEFSLGIFIDLAKAFDTVDHVILVNKLENYGIRGLQLKWFKNYLDQRLQCVNCNGATSKLKTIKCGVPQGSNLGPLLFLIYINDLPNASSILNLILFADDTNIFLSHKSIENLFMIANHELTLIADWFKANRLSLNLQKTNFVLFRSSRKSLPVSDYSLSIENSEISQVKSAKFLGVHIDEHLTWNVHINNIENKIAKNVGIMTKISYLLPSHILQKLYYALIHPYLTYCNISWASNYSTRLDRLMKLQKRAIRVITKSKYYAHTFELFQQVRILNIVKINKLQTGIFMFRYIHKALPLNFKDYFTFLNEIHNYNTRTKENLCPVRFRTNYRKHSIKHSGPVTWNNLPWEIRSLKILASFKNALRMHLLK